MPREISCFEECDQILVICKTGHIITAPPWPPAPPTFTPHRSNREGVISFEIKRGASERERERDRERAGGKGFKVLITRHSK